MLNEIVQQRSENASDSETDLAALAEHLSVIADALRKSSAGLHGLGQSLPTALSAPLITPGNAVGTAISEEQSADDALTAVQFYASDIKMKRSRYAKLARKAYALRRRRGVIFANDEIFGEPAWDILLDLYVAHVEGKSVSVSSACIGSAAPPTTGLRWLGVLAEQELILRQHDPEDQRRVLVRLTEKGLSAMDEYFASTGKAA